LLCVCGQLLRIIVTPIASDIEKILDNVMMELDCTGIYFTLDKKQKILFFLKKMILKNLYIFILISI